MADSTTTSTTSQAQANTTAQAQAQAQLNKSINDNIQGQDRLAQKLTRNTNLLNKFGNATRTAGRSIQGFFKTQTDVNTALDETSDKLMSVTDGLVNYSTKGKKATLGMQVEIQRLAMGMVDLAKKTEEHSKKLDDYLDVYKAIQVQIGEYSKSITELQTKKKQMGKLDEEEEKRLKELFDLRNKEKEQLKEQMKQVEIEASTVHRLNKEKVEQHNAMLNSIKDMRSTTREAERMEGGIKSVKAALGDMYDSKIFQWMESKAWTVVLAKSLSMANEAFSKTAEMYKTNTLLSRQYGIAAEHGLSGFINSAKMAESNAESLVKTAASLHMELTEVRDIAGQIQAQKLGVFGTKSAEEAQENVMKLTDAAAEFSKVTGTDGATAVELLRQRMEDMGMSTKEATADLGKMTTTLMQMQGSIEGDKVGMDDLVKQIQSAQANSSGFIVDTRLMTQAMRAAATEAERMGLSKKQALKASETMGKVITGGEGGKESGVAGMMAGMDIAKILKTGNQDQIDKVLEGMNDEQKKYLLTLKKEMQEHGMGEHQAGTLIQENMAGTDVMQRKTFEKIDQMYGKSSERANQLADLWHTSATAAEATYQAQKKAYNLEDRIKEEFKADQDRRVLALMDEAKYGKDAAIKNKASIDAIKKEKADIPAFGELMLRRAEDTNAALDKAKSPQDRTEILKKRHMSGKAAQEYLNIHDNKNTSAATKEAQETKFLAKYFDPAAKAKEESLTLKGMQVAKKSSSDMLKELQQSYGIDKDNYRANKQAQALAERAAAGDQDLNDGLEELYKSSNEQLQGVDLSNSFLQQIYQAIVNGDFLGKVGPVIGDAVTAAFAGGPVSLALGSAVGIAVTGVLIKFGPKLGLKALGTSFNAVKEAIEKSGKTVTKGVESAVETVSKADHFTGLTHDFSKPLPLGKTVSTGATATTELGEKAVEIATKPGTLSRIWEGVSKVGNAAKGKKGIAIIATAVAAAAAMAFSGKAKAATPDQDENKEPEKKEEEKPTSTTNQALHAATTTAQLTEVGLRVAAKFGAKGAAKLGAKTIGKAIPLLGTIVGAISTVSQISDMVEKSNSGKKLGAGDWTRLTAEVGSMLPFVGTAVALAGAGADITGSYDKLNDMTADKTSGPSPVEQGIQSIADSTGKIASQGDEDRQRQIQGLNNTQSNTNTLPPGGNFNAQSNIQGATLYNSVTGTPNQPQRPSLQDPNAQTNPTNKTGMYTDPNSYNEGEDSFSVKFFGVGSLIGLLHKKKATMATN